MNTIKLTAAVFAGALLTVAATGQTVVVSTGFDYTSGDYGGGSDTELLVIPVTGSYAVDRWTFKATIPYVRVSGPADVVPELGPIGRPGIRPGGGTASGLGDITLGATYAALTEPDLPNVDLTAKVKLGTADDDKGLGTGESDLMFQADVHQTIGRWTPFGTLGYRFLGDPNGVDLKDGFYLAGGASYQLDEKTDVGALLDWRQRVVSGIDDVAELVGFVGRKLDEQWKAQGYVLGGLTDASPDYGVGGRISYQF